MTNRAQHRLEDGLADLEHWYPSLEHLTFRTEFLELTRSQSDALVTAHRVRNDASVCTLLGHTAIPVLDREAAHLLVALSRKIQTVVDSIGGACFIRLNSRSPKDAAPVNRSDFELEAGRLGLTSANERLGLFCALSGAALKVCSGSEAVQLLCASQRVFSDLQQAEQAVCTGQAPWRMQLCLREWCAGVTDRREFRGFVHKGELVAVSQYNKLCYYPELIGKTAKLASDLTQFVQNDVRPILGGLGLESCVLDLACLDHDAIKVIEINPANDRTDPSLFDWEHDRKVLRGEDNFEFRLVGPPDEDKQCELQLKLDAMLANSVEDQWDWASALDESDSCRSAFGEGLQWVLLDPGSFQFHEQEQVP